MVPEARVELARLSTTVFETAASAIPPLGREIELYPMFPKAQTEISEHAQKAMIRTAKPPEQAQKHRSEATSVRKRRSEMIIRFEDVEKDAHSAPGDRCDAVFAANQTASELVSLQF